jgi:hypothetical protein
VFYLQKLPPQPDLPSGSDHVAKLAGFNLHVGVAAKAHQRDKVERLYPSIARPAIARQRLSLPPAGMVRYELKSPFRTGTSEQLQGQVRIIDCPEDPAVILQILAHLSSRKSRSSQKQHPPERAPPKKALAGFTIRRAWATSGPGCIFCSS